MSHVTCTFFTLGVQNVIPNGPWSVTAITSRSRQKNGAHGKITENRIVFEILSARQLL